MDSFNEYFESETHLNVYLKAEKKAKEFQINKDNEDDKRFFALMKKIITNLFLKAE